MEISKPGTIKEYGNPGTQGRGLARDHRPAGVGKGPKNALPSISGFSFLETKFLIFT